MELISMRVVNEMKMTEPVQACIKIIAGHYQLSEKDIWGLNLALEEAMANVIKYGFDQEQQHYFDVAVEVNETAFTVVIRDKGIPGDFIEDQYDDGLGISIMKHFLDQLIVKNRGFNGREQRLVKYLTGLPAYQRRVTEPTVNLAADLIFDYRPLRREEAIEVARCIYDEFEFSYSYEQAYYPDQFFEACQNGQIYSLVAVAPDGEVAGHLAAVRLDDFPGIAEMGMGVVKKKYRNYAVMKNLSDKIAAYCEAAADINAILVEPVAWHPITQKMCPDYGFIPCGFAFNISDLVNLDYQRGSLCLAIRAYQHTDTHTLYVPKQLQKTILKTYRNIGLIAEVGEKADHPEPEKSVMTIKKDRHNGLGKLFINQVGADITQQFRLALKTLKIERCPVVLLYLNLFDQGIDFAYQEAVAQGFFDVGCLPMSTDGDYLCMELLLDGVIDFNLIVTTPAFTALLEDLQLLAQ